MSVCFFATWDHNLAPYRKAHSASELYLQPSSVSFSQSYVWWLFRFFSHTVGEDAVEDEAEENPIVLEFQQEREAFYIKDPKKALQGFFDREGM